MSLIYALFLYFGMAGSAMPPAARTIAPPPGAMHQYHETAQPKTYVCNTPLTPWLCISDK